LKNFDVVAPGPEERESAPAERRSLEDYVKKIRPEKEATRVSPEVSMSVIEKLPLWQLDIGELTGHNLESRGREDVNALLQTGWLLLHIYTLKYQEDGVWRERPMAILGKLRSQPAKEAPDNV
jgi:hypothetical protein